MSGHIVFVRFFLGYSDSFPFDRFLRLPDGSGAIEAAMEALRKEWWRKRANQNRYAESQAELEGRRRKWREVALAQPSRNTHLPWSDCPDGDEPLPKRTGTPSFEEVARVAGWWDGTTCGGMVFGISRRYPVARFDTEDAASIAAAALQERVAELTRSTFTEERLSEGSIWLASANPHFVVVAEDQLQPVELHGVRERVRGLDSPGGKHQPAEEACLRAYWHMIRPTLEEITAIPPTDAVLPEMLSASDVAEHIDRNRSSVTSFLTRYAQKYPDCRVPIDSKRKNEPGYLYRVADVWPALEKWMKGKDAS